MTFRLRNKCFLCDGTRKTVSFLIYTPTLRYLVKTFQYDRFKCLFVTRCLRSTQVQGRSHVSKLGVSILPSLPMPMSQI